MHIVVTGMPAAGRSTVAALASRLSGLPVVNVGDVLAERLAEHGVTCETRAAIGPEYLRRFPATSIYSQAVSAAGERGAVFDGVRLALTCSQFRGRRDGTRILFVEAGSGVREKRLREQASDSLEAMEEYEQQQLIIRDFADCIIRNDGTVAELMRQVLRCVGRMVA